MASQITTRRKAKTDDLARRRFELMAAEHLRALGERIRARREELGLTQEEVARRMPGKIAGTRISLWERGKNRPHDDSLAELAKALETTPVALLVAETAPAPTPDPFPPAVTIDGELAEVLQAIKDQLAEQTATLGEMKGVLGEIKTLLQTEKATAETTKTAVEKVDKLVRRIDDDVRSGRLPGRPRASKAAASKTSAKRNPRA